MKITKNKSVKSKSGNSKLEKRIELQKRIIDELTIQNELLKKRNEELYNELVLEREKPNEEYERSKKLIAEIETYKEMYEKGIEELRESKEAYDSSREEFYILKKQYQKKMDVFLKKIKKAI